MQEKIFSKDVIVSDDDELQYLQTNKFRSKDNIVGNKYNSWTVLNKVDPFSVEGAMRYGLYEVKCECGTLNRLSSYVITASKSKMCKRCYIKSRKNNQFKFCR